MPSSITKIVAVAAGAMAMGLSGAAHAGSERGTVTELHVRGDGLISFYLSGVHRNRPSCAPRNKHWTIDERTEAGKMQYSMLLAAVRSGLELSVTGANRCTRTPDVEDVHDLVMER